jgi:hypothetical protein
VTNSCENPACDIRIPLAYGAILAWKGSLENREDVRKGQLRVRYVGMGREVFTFSEEGNGCERREREGFLELERLYALVDTQ